MLLEINKNYATAKKKIINKCEKHFLGLWCQDVPGVKLSLIIVSVKMSSGLRNSRQDVTYTIFN